MSRRNRTDLDSGQAGSVLMLMPAAVLVLVILAALAVDAGITFMGQRELQNATAAAANDAAVAALAESSLYECGALDIAEDRARAVAETAFSARVADVVETTDGPHVVVGGGSGEPLQVTVSAAGSVELLFTPAVAGAASREVTATTTASPRLEPGRLWPTPDDC